MVTVLPQGDFRFNNNLEYLRNGLQQGHLCFQGSLIHHSPMYYFNKKRRLYDFTRSANAFIRDQMASFLVNSLGQPQLQEPLRTAFNSLYDYWKYHSGVRCESLSMLIFVYNQGGQYVAHVTFNSNTFKSAHNQYAVAVTLDCQRFTYFQLRDVLSVQMSQLQLWWWKWRSTRIVNEHNVWRRRYWTVQTCRLIINWDKNTGDSCPIYLTLSKDRLQGISCLMANGEDKLYVNRDYHS